MRCTSHMKCRRYRKEHRELNASNPHTHGEEYGKISAGNISRPRFVPRGSGQCMTIPTNAHLYSIRLRDTPMCLTCGKTDTTFHREMCSGASDIWIWTRFRIALMLRVDPKHVPFTWLLFPAMQIWSLPRQNAILWVLGHYGILHDEGPPDFGDTRLYQLSAEITMEDVPVGWENEGIWELSRRAGITQVETTQPATDSLYVTN
jgi:hypothetical protein